ncbi:MAG: hypothetical protein ABI607_05875 [Betaproteobacteria bacterium]
MKLPALCVVLSLALPVPGAQAAEVGVFSLVEGPARVLRDTTWYKLVPGTRFRDGDIVVSKGPGQVQVELTAGGRFNLGTPATLFAAAVPVVGDKLTGPVDIMLPNGWLKLAASAPPLGFRVQFDAATLVAAEAIVVMHAQSSAADLFVESGSARLTEAGTGGGKAPVATDLKAGEFAAQASGRPLRLERRAPAAFVAAIPRHLIDALPILEAKYKTAKVQLVAEQEVTYAEAEPWLMGPYRKLFMKRFQPRLRDREFRAAVEVNIARYPEWDRILHPEKYLPKVPVEAK